MYCLKCGKEIPDSQVFCNDCLADMEAHPVRSDIPVQLPVRSPIRRQAPQRKETPPEEEISFLKKSIRWIMLLVTVLALALCLSITSLMYLRNILSPEQGDIGQNYKTAPVTTPVTVPQK